MIELDTATRHPDEQTDAWLRLLVGRAATLYERRSIHWVTLRTEQESDSTDDDASTGGSVEAAAEGDSVKILMDAWKEQIGGDEERFSERLSLDGLDPDAAEELLKPASWPEGADLPSWALFLTDVMHRVEQRPDAAIYRRSYGEGVPFQEFVADFVEEAAERVQAQCTGAIHRLHDDAFDDLRHRLLRRLSRLAGQVVTLEFRAYRAARESPADRLARATRAEPGTALYRAFVAMQRSDGLRSLFDEYASLARLLATSTEQWIDAVAELLQRLDADAPELARLFDLGTGRVRRVDADASDPHRGGRRVAILTFEDGGKLVYKPRDQRLEAAWFRFLVRLNGPIPLRSLRTLTRDGYGWVEYARPEALEDEADAGEYYRRVGALLAVLHLVAATDCHYENVIACGADPVLVDAETILHASLAPGDLPDGFGAQELAERFVDQSVVRSGLIPRWSFRGDGEADDLSGLRAAAAPSRREFADFDALGTDDLRLRPRRAAGAETPNLPVRDGRVATVMEHQSAFASGFETMMRFFASDRARLADLLDGFDGLSSRFVFRPTQVYADLIEDAHHPDLMRTGIRRSLHFEALARLAVIRRSSPEWWPLLASEHGALDGLDVPTFSARVDEAALRADDGTVVGGLLDEPPLIFVQRRLARWDEADLHAQLELLWGSLYSRDVSRPHHAPVEDVEGGIGNSGPDDVDYVVEAMRIAHRLREAAFQSDDGSCTWIGFEHVMGTGHFRLQPVTGALYAGSMGIALFFAALYDRTRKETWRQLAGGAVRHIAADIRQSGREGYAQLSHGGVAGIGALLYGYARLAAHTGDDRYVHQALEAASLFTDERIGVDSVYDVCGGAAGSLLGLLALWHRTGEDELLRKAVACGERLLDGRVEDPRTGRTAWATIEPHPLAGMSHGSAGIALALARLASASGAARFAAAASEALAFERDVFDPQAGNWPDFRDKGEAGDGDLVSSWCHGAPGVGMARAAMVPIMRGPLLYENIEHEIEREIERAARTTARGGIGRGDNLCCGNFGRVDALLTMGRTLDRRDWIRQAHALADSATATARRKGGFGLLPGVPRGVLHPGFFQGLAGIGYTYLRLDDPDHFPSVLTWDDGVTAR